MVNAKTALLGAYYYGAYPWRSWRNAQWSAAGRAPAMVLFYHRIADWGPNDWTASNRSFANQVRWLKRRFDMVSLGEAQRRVASGENSRPSITITFDDGYADNCDQAIPLLLSEGIPCVYFVSSDFVRSGKPFPHDTARGQPLRPNTPQQLREMSDAGIEIGAHTRSHADLGREYRAGALVGEIVGSKHDLEDLIGKPVRYFAFPYGQHRNLNPLAFEIARDHGFEAACSAYGGFNFPGDDPFHLQRIPVDNHLVRLKNWVTIDPRKMRGTCRYGAGLAPRPIMGGTP